MSIILNFYTVLSQGFCP